MIETTQQAPETNVNQGTSLLTKNRITTGLATAAVVGVGAALIEVEWITRIALGRGRHGRSGIGA